MSADLPTLKVLLFFRHCGRAFMISYIVIFKLLPVTNCITSNKFAGTNLQVCVLSQSAREHCSLNYINGHQRRFVPFLASRILKIGAKGRLYVDYGLSSAIWDHYWYFH